ncbi:hypothetical protein Poly51_28990 [Rubripirellula tenax]|uniref:Uncharacterized protein n=1 Tax=Rubripirellula tenax TaxID=2528015 RepID=A0A5C6FBK0_9BACT|nr:hypothetical protein [Rubripirellula tenax]TWU56979.1 hypothetical protein Poly51_28990 [Rubripirellula tenax]
MKTNTLAVCPLNSPFAVITPLVWMTSLLICVVVSGTVMAADQADIDDEVGMTAEKDSQPKFVDGRFIIPPIQGRSTAFEGIGNGKTPDGFREGEERPLQALPESGADRAGNWSWSMADWAAPNTYSNPRYFEDRMLERHGHERFGIAQPLASGVRFFATVPMLPYLMAISHPCDCEYTLGYYRPGSCAPRTFQRPPWDRRAIIAESAAVATGMIVLP